MIHKYNRSKFFYLFISIYAYTTTATAQHIPAANSHYSVYEKAGQIILSDGKTEEYISTNAGDTLPILKGNEIYYASNSAENKKGTGGTIIVYNINDKSKSDVLRTKAVNEDYTFTDPIVNMLFDKITGKMYFSTAANIGAGVFMTWAYDMNTKKLAPYKDGLIKDVDMQGNQTIFFYGHDYKGNYSKKNIYTKDGAVYESFDRDYVAYQVK